MLVSVALAQVDAHGAPLAAFDADPRDPIRFQRPGAMVAGDAFVGGMFGYARRPLVARDDNSGAEVPLLDDVYSVDLSAGFAVTAWLRLDVAVPLYGFRGNTIDDFASPQSVSGLGVADSRISALAVMIAPGADEQGFSMGIVPHVDLPTGQFHDTFGRGNVAAGANLVVGQTSGSLSISGRAGVQLDARPESGVPAGPSARLGLSATWLLDDRFGVGAEVDAGLPLHSEGGGIPLEALARVRSGTATGAHYAAGLGVGLSSGVGTPAFRAFVGGGFGRSGRPRDSDGDGLVDSVDQCPEQPETANGLRDDDGCPDSLPQLSVSATLDEVPLEGVTVHLEGPAERTFTSSDRPETLPVDASTSWKATGTLGDCLRGAGVVSVAEEDTHLQVVMSRVTDAEVVLLVLDNRGLPAEGALLEFTSSDAYCVPPEFVTVPADGRVVVGVGVGTHTIVGTSGEHTGSDVVTAVAGKTHDVVLVLR